MSLSPHFEQVEFEKDAPIPADCVGIFTRLAMDILEPIRAELNRQMLITSGYRPPSVNEAIHGALHSEHVATPDYCAADFVFHTSEPTVYTCRMIFDWIRASQLPFHQCILESDPRGGSIIHVSICPAKLPQRQALIGSTYNSSPYSSADVVAYNPQNGGQENA